jgi:uncharacterized repeat protein (TIGR01451 family)
MIRGKARIGLASVLGLAALLVALMLAAPAQTQAPPGDPPGPPSGDGIQPVFVDGNPTCSVLDPGTLELRVQPVVEGIFSDGFLTVTITDIRETDDGPVFDWTSNIGVDSIFVKGGNGGNFYLYDPPAENTGDTNLHSPINPQNQKFAGLSHISFCYDIQPSIKVEKSGDVLSKVGDEVKYDFKITNDGDIPLNLDSVTDTLLGDLEDDAPTACDTLAAGANCVFSVNRTVQAGDPDPLPNTVTVQYKGTLPGGASTTVTDSDDHSVNLFQPAVTIEKTGDALSKVGDTVNYTITVTNTSSDDSPDLMCDVTDTVLGTLEENLVLDSQTGESKMFTPSHVVQGTDPDPLVNTATVDCDVVGFPNKVSDSAQHSVNLFQPSVKIEKTGDALSKVGDTVNYEIKVTNTSSADSPNLSCDIKDATVGVDKQNVELAPGGTDTTNVPFVIPVGADDPFVNTASVDCDVDGFPNQLATQTASHSVNLFQPSVQVVKTGPSEAVEGDTITYNYTITNNGSADSPNLILESVIDDVVGSLTAVATANGCATLTPVAPGNSCTFTANFTIPAGTPSPLVNTVVVDYHPDGFENEIKDDDDHSVIVKPPEKFEGCTPGFWKNHLQAWVGFSPNQTLESVFDVPNSFGLDNNTLLQALSFQGGSGTVGAARILLRAAVAALLNAAHPGIDYPRTVAEVIADVNAALASGNRATMLTLATELDTDNNLGCPI